MPDGCLVLVPLDILDEAHQLPVEHAARAAERERGVQSLRFVDELVNPCKVVVSWGFQVGERKVVNFCVDFKRENLAHGIGQRMVRVGQAINRNAVVQSELGEGLGDFCQVALRRKLVDALEGIAHEITHADNVCLGECRLELFGSHVRVIDKREPAFPGVAVADN